jgi:hypothetical protein
VDSSSSSSTSCHDGDCETSDSDYEDPGVGPWLAAIWSGGHEWGILQVAEDWMRLLLGEYKGLNYSRKSGGMVSLHCRGNVLSMVAAGLPSLKAWLAVLAASAGRRRSHLARALADAFQAPLAPLSPIMGRSRSAICRGWRVFWDFAARMCLSVAALPCNTGRSAAYIGVALEWADLSGFGVHAVRERPPNTELTELWGVRAELTEAEFVMMTRLNGASSRTFVSRKWASSARRPPGAGPRHRSIVFGISALVNGACANTAHHNCLSASLVDTAFGELVVSSDEQRAGGAREIVTDFTVGCVGVNMPPIAVGDEYRWHYGKAFGVQCAGCEAALHAAGLGGSPTFGAVFPPPVAADVREYDFDSPVRPPRPHSAAARLLGKEARRRGCRNEALYHAGDALPDAPTMRRFFAVGLHQAGGTWASAERRAVELSGLISRMDEAGYDAVFVSETDHSTRSGLATDVHGLFELVHQGAEGVHWYRGLAGEMPTGTTKGGGAAIVWDGRIPHSDLYVHESGRLVAVTLLGPGLRRVRLIAVYGYANPSQRDGPAGQALCAALVRELTAARALQMRALVGGDLNQAALPLDSVRPRGAVDAAADLHLPLLGMLEDLFRVRHPLRPLFSRLVGDGVGATRISTIYGSTALARSGALRAGYDTECASGMPVHDHRHGFVLLPYSRTLGGVPARSAPAAGACAVAPLNFEELTDAVGAAAARIVMEDPRLQACLDAGTALPPDASPEALEGVVVMWNAIVYDALSAVLPRKGRAGARPRAIPADVLRTRKLERTSRQMRRLLRDYACVLAADRRPDRSRLLRLFRRLRRAREALAPAHAAMGTPLAPVPSHWCSLEMYQSWRLAVLGACQEAGKLAAGRRATHERQRIAESVQARGAAFRAAVRSRRPKRYLNRALFDGKVVIAPKQVATAGGGATTSPAAYLSSVRTLFHEWTLCRKADPGTPLDPQLAAVLAPYGGPERFASLMRPRTQAEWMAALAASPSGSAPGASGIPYAALKQLPAVVLACMFQVLNVCLSSAALPASFLLGVIVPIPKKGSTTVAKSRPITLLESPLKLLTRALAGDVMKELVEHKLLHRAQFAYQAGRACGDPAHVLLGVLEDAKARSRRLHVVLFDVEKAFDSIEPWALESCYRRFGLPEAFITLMHCLDAGGRAQVRTQAGLTEEFGVGRGVRQGEVLSPLKFILWLDGWLCYRDAVCGAECGYQLAGGTLVSALAYADDVCIVAGSFAGLQRQVATYCVFLRHFGVSLNVSKTVYVSRTAGGGGARRLALSRFDRETALSYRWTLAPKGPAEVFEYLGSTFNLALDWPVLAAALAKKVEYFISLLARKRLSLPESLTLVNTVLRGRLGFYVQTCQVSPALLRKWDVRLHRALRRHGGLYVSSSMAFVGLPPSEHGLGLFSFGGLQAETLGCEWVTRLNSSGLVGAVALETYDCGLQKREGCLHPSALPTRHPRALRASRFAAFTHDVLRGLGMAVVPSAQLSDLADFLRRPDGSPAVMLSDLIPEALWPALHRTPVRLLHELEGPAGVLGTWEELTGKATPPPLWFAAVEEAVLLGRQLGHADDRRCRWPSLPTMSAASTVLSAGAPAEGSVRGWSGGPLVFSGDGSRVVLRDGTARAGTGVVLVKGVLGSLTPSMGYDGVRRGTVTVGVGVLGDRMATSDAMEVLSPITAMRVSPRRAALCVYSDSDYTIHTADAVLGGMSPRRWTRLANWPLWLQFRYMCEERQAAGGTLELVPVMAHQEDAAAPAQSAWLTKVSRLADAAAKAAGRQLPPEASVWPGAQRAFNLHHRGRLVTGDARRAIREAGVMPARLHWRSLPTQGFLPRALAAGEVHLSAMRATLSLARLVEWGAAGSHDFMFRLRLLSLYTPTKMLRSGGRDPLEVVVPVGARGEALCALCPEGRRADTFHLVGGECLAVQECRAHIRTRQANRLRALATPCWWPGAPPALGLRAGLGAWLGLVHPDVPVTVAAALPLEGPRLTGLERLVPGRIRRRYVPQAVVLLVSSQCAHLPSAAALDAVRAAVCADSVAVYTLVGAAALLRAGAPPCTPLVYFPEGAVPSDTAVPCPTRGSEECEAVEDEFVLCLQHSGAAPPAHVPLPTALWGQLAALVGDACVGGAKDVVVQWCDREVSLLDTPTADEGAILDATGLWPLVVDRPADDEGVLGSQPALLSWLGLWPSGVDGGLQASLRSLPAALRARELASVCVDAVVAVHALYRTYRTATKLVLASHKARERARVKRALQCGRVEVLVRRALRPSLANLPLLGPLPLFRSGARSAVVPVAGRAAFCARRFLRTGALASREAVAEWGLLLGLSRRVISAVWARVRVSATGRAQVRATHFARLREGTGLAALLTAREAVRFRRAAPLDDTLLTAPADASALLLPPMSDVAPSPASSAAASSPTPSVAAAPSPAPSI